MRGKLAFLSKIVVRGLQSYWRLSRGMELVAQACVIDGENRVGLVKLDQRDGWQLPRSSVRQGEGLEDALRRLLADGCGIAVVDRPALFWMYAGDAAARPSRQTGLFVVRRWTRTVSPEDMSLTFFPADALPPELDAKDAARICQASEDRAPFEVC
jgi:ADP-ribose pyrophosphatase YjhB (NUDIX family)